MDGELHQMTIHGLGALLKQHKTSAVEITEAVFERIGAVEEKVHAYITLTREAAMQQARRAQDRIMNNDGGPLTGIPLGIKDIICMQGLRTTCGSKMLEDFEPPYDATVIEMLKAQGAVFTGKTNMDEFAMGSSSETSCFGPVRNPWNLRRVAGGSSGGSAAAVAAGECIASLGTDTGGSIRQPASHCGTVGLKPTYGRVSRFGLVAYASSLDQIGPITRDVEDAAILLNHICGHDARDATSSDRPAPDYTRALARDAGGLILGIPAEYFAQGLDPEVEKAVREAVRELERRGAAAREISLPHSAFAVAAYYLIAPSEAGSNLARYDGVRYGRRRGDNDLERMYRETRAEGFGSEVKRRIMLGTFALSAGYHDAYYRKASQVRDLIRRDFEAAFGRCDVILAPTAPSPPFALGEKMEDPLGMYLEDIFTVPASLAGLPGISVPCGHSRDGLPIGLQILGNHFEEEKILRCAFCFEQSTDWHLKRPPL